MAQKKQKIILILILVGFMALVCAGDFALAQRDLEVIDYPDVPGAAAPGRDTTLPQYIKYLFNFGIALGGILVFLVFVSAGIRWSTSAGDPTKIAQAKSRMLAGIIGLALLLFCYLIITAINPNLKTFQDVKEMPQSVGIYITGDVTDNEGNIYQEERCYQGSIPGFTNFTPTSIKFISNEEELLAIFVYSQEEYKGTSTRIENKGKGTGDNISGESIDFLWNKPGTYLYEKTNFEIHNRQPKFCTGLYQDLSKDNWDNKTQSLKFNNIPGAGLNFGAVLFSENDFEGSKCGYAFEKDVADLSLGSNNYLWPIEKDNLSSMIVLNTSKTGGTVTFYDSINCQGREKTYTTSDVLAINDLTKDNCSFGDCLFGRLNADDIEKELHRNIMSMRIEGDMYALLKSQEGEEYVPPPWDEEKIEFPPGIPVSECTTRVLAALANGTEFDIVRPTKKDLRSRFPETRGGWHGETPTNFSCDEVCANRGQDCLGIGLYNVEKTFCRYIIHNIGSNCQLSANLEWGECGMGFRYGSGFCEESSPVWASWGYADTGCYCVNKGILEK
ncbi:hypothetical protein KAW43_02780 [Candidatus Parcubacteria bacterium]|nr:hypothetical protein [Candidatus Parcubacteria bacterium]